MSPIIGLCGPSGAGKSTLLRALDAHRSRGVPVVPLTITRPPHKGEVQETEYELVNRGSFLRSMVNDEFVDYTEYKGNLFGVRRSVLEAHLSSSAPAILAIGLTSIITLKKTYPTQVGVAFVYPGDAGDLRSCGLDPDSPPNRELSRRLSERVSSGAEGVIDLGHWLELRMTTNLWRAASLLREINLGLDITIIRNERDRLAEAVSSLETMLTHPGKPRLLRTKEGSLRDS